jgi:D-sorbitol dehydrogenase (acceptor)
MKLKDKVALVTGGARGIGAAIADRHVAGGARVAVADISLADAEETEARHGDRAVAVALDVTKAASIEAAVESVVQRWGGVDILVYNAAIFDMAPIVEVTETSHERVFAVNVKGLFFTLQALAKRMTGAAGAARSSTLPRRLAAAAKRWCRSTAPQDRGHQHHAVGRARSHQAPHQRQRHFAQGRRHGDVDRVGALFAKYEHRPLGEKRRPVGEAVPFGRMGLPADHAGASVFLASSDSDYVVAQTLNVDGGNWMS